VIFKFDKVALPCRHLKNGLLAVWMRAQAFAGGNERQVYNFPIPR